MIRDLNSSAPPRPGEELDAARLAEYLHGALAGDGAIEIEQFPSGHSNLTYLVRRGGLVRRESEEWVLRRPPFGSKVKSAHDMGREYRVLSRLSKVYPPAPEPILYCEDESVLGAPFYLMRRLHGMVLRRKWPESITGDPALSRRICEAFIDNLAALHAVDAEAAGLGDFGRPQGYVRRQVEGWSKRWTDARTEDIPDMDSTAAWLGANMPPDGGAAIIHNDYKFDNVLLDPDDPTRVTGVLDWEMATLGDPLMDFGTALSYWIDASDPAEFRALAFSPTWMPGFLDRRGVVERYEQATGRSVAHPIFYYSYGLFKLAVILQQIYYRYFHGLTKDERFGEFRFTVRKLARQAAASIAAQSLQPGQWR
ncbi:MAG: phosphotransferase family protein [Bryobacteraceae bacterium]